MNFDETYYTTDIKGAIDHPHFKERANWIDEYITGDNPKVYILGCGFGYIIKHLRLLGVNAYGVELPYAYSQRVTDYMFECDIKDADMSDADYIFSWNILDCLSDDSVKGIIENLKKFTCPQIHILCASGDYKGYFIKPVDYWCSFLPKAIIVDYETKTGLKGLPLSWGFVSD